MSIDDSEKRNRELCGDLPEMESLVSEVLADPGLLAELRRAAERRVWGLLPDEPAPELTHCLTCGQKLRAKKSRPDFHGLKVIK